MSYETECVLVAFCSALFFTLAIILGVLISEWFVLIVLGFPIPLAIFGIRYSD